MPWYLFSYFVSKESSRHYAIGIGRKVDTGTLEIYFSCHSSGSVTFTNVMVETQQCIYLEKWCVNCSHWTCSVWVIVFHEQNRSVKRVVVRRHLRYWSQSVLHLHLDNTRMTFYLIFGAVAEEQECSEWAVHFDVTFLYRFTITTLNGADDGPRETNVSCFDK